MIPAESQSSARLDLPYLQAGQMQKHVTLNEALTRLDVLVQCAVVSRSVNEQPETPDEGALFIRPEGATGDAWSGMAAGALTRFEAGGWTALTPAEGMRVFVLDEQRLIVWSAEGWMDVGGTPVRLDDLEGLGVGTASDGTNIFAAKLNSALWTARTEGEGGTGDLRYALNKESGADVLSLLFQSGWSGRAELGLVGDDDLVLKVSPDGDAWREAVRVDRHTGRVGFPVMDALLRPATQDALTAFETPPGRARAFLLDDLIAALERAGVWSRLTALYVTAAGDAQAATINLKAPGAYPLTPVSGPAFAADEGYTTDGVASWLDTGLSAETLADGGTGVAAGVWLSGTPGGSLYLLGPVDGAETLSMVLSTATGNFSARLGSSTLTVFGVAPATSGHFAASRENGTDLSGYHDGVLISTQTSAFTGYGDGSTGLLRRYGGYYGGSVAAAWLGKGLDAAQIAALHAALATYLGETGAV